MRMTGFSLIFILLLVLNVLSCGGGGGGGGPVTGSATISGTVLYEDKLYNTAGFTGTGYKPVRYASVEIVDASNDVVLATGSTGTDGSYSINFPYSGTDVYVRALAETTFAPGKTIEVDNNSGTLYSVATDTLTVSDHAAYTRDLSITVASGAGGAFNMLDVYTAGAQFVHSLSGEYPPSLRTFWHAGSASPIGGTAYCTGCSAPGDGIYIGGGTGNGVGDTDEYDDDVLWHEFAHFIAAQFSRDDSPGGYHELSSNDLDLRLAWSEGWGDFFPGAVKTWVWNNADPSIKGVFSAASPPTMALTRYIDTMNAGLGISFDMAVPGGSPYVYAGNEVAVAKILLDLDAAFTMQPIWDVIAGFNSFNPASPLQVNFEAFWDSWLSQRTPGGAEMTTLQSILTDRSILYAADGYEDDNTTVSASTYTVGVSAPQNHTLYPAGDADFVVLELVSATTYTIGTSALTSGADTYIELYDNGGTLMALSDNNPLSTRASLLTFTPGSSGSYYVKVKTSPNRPVSSGRYGSYTLAITGP